MKGELTREGRGGRREEWKERICDCVDFHTKEERESVCGCTLHYVELNKISQRRVSHTHSRHNDVPLANAHL